MSDVIVKDKRTAILDATLALIAERGFHGTPMSQVAKRSGVSAGIIYHYFENKDDLIHELYKHIKSKFSAALVHGLVTDASWDVIFKQMWMNAYQFYVLHPEETLVLEQYDNSPYAHGWHEYAAMDENMQTLMAMFGGVVKAGHIRQLPMEVFYELTFGVAISIAKRQISGVIQVDDALLNKVAEACFRAVSV